jgi:hypothetical protein
MQNYHFSSGGSQFSPFVAVQYLGTPGYPTSECAYLGNGFQAGSTTNYRQFSKGYEDTASSPTACAVFTRVSVTPAGVDGAARRLVLAVVDVPRCDREMGQCCTATTRCRFSSR